MQYSVLSLGHPVPVGREEMREEGKIPSAQGYQPPGPSNVS